MLAIAFSCLLAMHATLLFYFARTKRLERARTRALNAEETEMVTSRRRSPGLSTSPWKRGNSKTSNLATNAQQIGGFDPLSGSDSEAADGATIDHHLNRLSIRNEKNFSSSEEDSDEADRKLQRVLEEATHLRIVEE